RSAGPKSKTVEGGASTRIASDGGARVVDARRRRAESRVGGAANGSGERGGAYESLPEDRADREQSRQRAGRGASVRLRVRRPIRQGGERTGIRRGQPTLDRHQDDTWGPDGWKDRSGPSQWGAATIDVERGMVSLPIGNPADNFYGADRKGTNLYANSVVA